MIFVNHALTGLSPISADTHTAAVKSFDGLMLKPYGTHVCGWYVHLRLSPPHVRAAWFQTSPNRNGINPGDRWEKEGQMMSKCEVVRLLARNGTTVHRVYPSKGEKKRVSEGVCCTWRKMCSASVRSDVQYCLD